MPENDKIKQFLIEKRKDRRRKVAVTAAASITISLVIALVIITSLMMALSRGDKPGTSDVTDNAGKVTEKLPPDTTSQAETTDEPASSTDAETSEPETTESSSTATPAIPVDYDYTRPVPEAPPVDKSFYDDALFIGDSRTEGFRMYAGLNNATYYSAKGLMANTTFTERFIPTDGFDVPPDADLGDDGKLTVAQALEYGRSFGKIYIMLGINEIGWPNAQAFIGYYRQLIALVRKFNPGAQIYVQLIIPVSKSKSDSDDVYNNERIAMFNNLIVEMCVDEKVFFINTPEAVGDEIGALPEDAGIDGVHMKKSYCEQWRDYLFTHTVSA